MKKNKMICGVLVLLLVCFLSTGCKKQVKELYCVKKTNKNFEVYGDITTAVRTEFDMNGKKPKKSNVDIVIDVNKIETTPEKMNTFASGLKESLCGSNKIIPERDCNPVVEGTAVKFKSKGDFNEYFVNYTDDEVLDDMKKFLEEHEGMTCDVTTGEYK
jgi:hypothetical protein